ncbi:flagellar biosynthetic protein FliR [Sphingomonas sp. S-NIH.Pt15_0812]|uniref:flagellar biosynthetic protein FliR n=1 Tax=Sphingomonas sp. S-NIH.Pt15_0812 TaxID=1920129 RepID=UPI001F49D5B8|nr:flagellar biosynthetic protein FliR [Sphingomonas sp. S-NIH.Pt15_0812]
MDAQMLQALPVEASAFFILFARIGAVLMLLPVFSDDAIPQRIRLMIAFGMTVALWGLLSPPALVAAHDGDHFVGTLVSEMVVGLALGSLVRMMFMAVQMAGSIISLQIGLTSVLVADASQGGQAMLLSKFVGVAASVMCMAMLVHHLWIVAIVKSYASFPIGGMPVAGDFAQIALATAGRSMTLAISLSAPMLVYGIVFNVALGLCARLAPALQIFFVAQPLNLLLGLALFATIVGALLSGFATAMGQWVQSGWAG